ncbi:unnamed protein product [Paramecium octaurelia]|uniref:Uncharacterized protein n=1 Tax=Paramecium octaurelia TaxID=43137 RepID=A0A8S1SP93_PAROT|nr:unnamed protein product [Paramecium octaurelia]
MIIRKPTTITLKPEDDYQEYEDFKKRQEEQKKSQMQQKKEMFTWSQQQQAQAIYQAPKNTRRSIQVAQEPTIEFEPDSYFDINNQIPVNQLFRMINPSPDAMQQEPQ